jgi:putative two-component system response regulator
LKGKQIPIAAYIIAVIDFFDARTSERPYRKAWSSEDALLCIDEQIETLFDPEVVKVFLKEIKNINL